jgi:hypothetical protein
MWTRRRDFDGCSLDGVFCVWLSILRFDAGKCLSVSSDLSYLLSDRLGTCSLRPLAANYVLEQVSVTSGVIKSPKSL